MKKFLVYSLVLCFGLVTFGCGSDTGKKKTEPSKPNASGESKTETKTETKTEKKS